MKKNLVAVAIVLCFAMATVVMAGDNFVEVNKIDLSKEDEGSLSAVLTKNTGKVVNVKLKSGEEMSGKVVMVWKGLVHLSELKGREFFDAVIDMDSVAAVVIQVRTLKK